MTASVSVRFRSSTWIIMFPYANMYSSGVNLAVTFVFSSIIPLSCRVIQRRLFICLASNLFRCLSSSASFAIRAVFYFGCSIWLCRWLKRMCWSWFVICCASLPSLRPSLQFRLMHSRFLSRTLCYMLSKFIRMTVLMLWGGCLQLCLVGLNSPASGPMTDSARVNSLVSVSIIPFSYSDGGIVVWRVSASESSEVCGWGCWMVSRSEISSREGQLRACVTWVITVVEH